MTTARAAQPRQCHQLVGADGGGRGEEVVRGGEVYTVLNGDARRLSLPDGSVQCIVTSVPYWGLRRYLDDHREIGREESLAQWLDAMVACGREWWRVLRDDGTLWCNVGSGYASSSLSARPSNPGLTGSNELNPRRILPSDGLKPKDDMMLPSRLALAFQADGWFLRSQIVWAKGLDWTDTERQAQQQIRDALATVRQEAAGSLWGLSNGLDNALTKAERAVDRLAQSGSVMPESVTDRCTSAYEMVFMFSKRSRYYFDAEAIRVPQSGTAHSRGNGLTPKGAAAESGNRANDSFHAALTSTVVPGGRNARNVWRIPTESQGAFHLPDGRTASHFAAFPRALAARAILASTSERGACSTCGAAFVRVREKTAEYQALCDSNAGKWHLAPEEELEKGGVVLQTTKHGGLVASYRTVGWIPGCRCHGAPTPARVPCKRCGGTGREKEWEHNSERAQKVEQTGREDGYFLGSVSGGVGNAERVETGNQCPHCDDGNVDGEVWDDAVLEAWPVMPCVVLDPMGGSGTTALAALDLGRSAIVNDLNPLYCDLMQARLDAWPEKLRAPADDMLEELPLWASF
jgi:DNA modification methylase